MSMTEAMMYVSCPVCGAVQGKSGSGTRTETSCRKCKAELNYEVLNNTVKVLVMKGSPKHRVSPHV